MTWQPIETAPKQGRILLYQPEHQGADYTCDEEIEIGFWLKGGWQMADHQTGIFDTGFPTHWMPLPEPPQ